MDGSMIEAIKNSQILSNPEDTDDLIDGLADARIVLLGEATHGTSEFCSWRAQITRRLIEERGFSLVGVEGDWSACCRANLYISGRSDENLSSAAVLNASFERWPTWMWANWEIASLVQWLRDYNLSGPGAERQVKLYGLDLYGLWESLEEISGYLARVDPEGAQAASEAYECFEPFRGLEEYYASARRLVPDTCREEVIALLRQVRERSREYPEGEDCAVECASERPRDRQCRELLCRVSRRRGLFLERQRQAHGRVGREYPEVSRRQAPFSQQDDCLGS